MDIENLIFDLAQMPGPDRKADRTIASFIGMENISNGGEENWTLNGINFRRIPGFTFTIDAALLIGDSLGLESCGACTFGADTATAVLAGEEPVSGKTPAIAICIAYLQSIARQNTPLN